MSAPRLTQTGYKVLVTRNKYGDTIYSTATALSCLYRDISSLELSGKIEGINTDGLVWLAPNAGVVKGDVLLIDNVYYRIAKIIKARDRLRDNAVRFLKCEVNEQRRVS